MQEMEYSILGFQLLDKYYFHHTNLLYPLAVAKVQHQKSDGEMMINTKEGITAVLIIIEKVDGKTYNHHTYETKRQT